MTKAAEREGRSTSALERLRQPRRPQSTLICEMVERGPAALQRVPSTRRQVDVQTRSSPQVGVGVRVVDGETWHTSVGVANDNAAHRCEHPDMPTPSLPTHTPIDVAPRGWKMYVSRSTQPVRRLVVFIHGFRGQAVQTWMSFPQVSNDQTWWTASDLLFVGYRSTRDTITGVAHQVRREIKNFFPSPYPDAMSIDGVPARDNVQNYEEFILVGHSLGGLIARRALCDEAQKWLDAGSPSERSGLLDCELRLFSPASAGFRPAGVLGVLEAAGALRALEMALRSSSAYVDLQSGSEVLVQTRERTESLVRESGMSSLKAHIVWSNPDNVVVAERYTTDWVDDAWAGVSHASVCKPSTPDFSSPWHFVETGEA